ncbi:MAG: hypothetical protein ACJA13_001588 [Paraglaciecola sp.]|jgi:hypothetical protein
MGIITKSVNSGPIIKRQIRAAWLTVLSSVFMTLPAQSVELAASFHQGDQSQSKGYSLAVTDNFARRSPFYWTVAYNKLDKVFIDWNDSSLSFPLESIETSLSYRHKLSSRNPAMRRVSIEYQAGVSTVLTENKFVWSELNEEKYFSEKGDVNGFVAITAHYQFASNTSVHLGLKHLPNVSEFGAISSVFLGLSYRFGANYHGNIIK